MRGEVKMYIYIAAKETAENEEGKFITYGIKCYDLSKGTLAAEIHDVFCDKSDAERFAEKCSTENLDPIHLPEAAADAIWSSGTEILL